MRSSPRWKGEQQIDYSEAKGNVALNRNERRRQRASVLGRFASHPTAKRLLANYQRYGREAAEIYIQNDDGSGIPRYFDVFSAKLWCAKHRRIEALEIDQKLVKELTSNGAIDFEHLRSKKFDEDVAPIIFLLDATIAGGLLLDGAHRYVAFTEKSQELEMAGLSGRCQRIRRAERLESSSFRRSSEAFSSKSSPFSSYSRRWRLNQRKLSVGFAPNCGRE